MSAADPLAGREVFFEFITVGDYVRVAAVDAATAIEVYVSGPVNTPQFDLERLAGRKLARKLGLLDPGGADGEGGESKTPRRGGRGVIV